MKVISFLPAFLAVTLLVLGVFWISRNIEVPDSNAQKIQNIIDRYEQPLDASVYVKNLNTGAEIFVNDEIKYFPASTFKVPIMMAFLRFVQDDPKILDKEYTYRRAEGEENPQQIIPPSKTLAEGEKYSIRELIDYMVVYSDNAATEMFEALIGDLRQENPYTDLLVQLNLPAIGIPQVTPSEYSRLLTSLHEATFLNRQWSDYALEVMSRAEYKKGLVAGVPEDTKVAHKFGDFGQPGDPYHELHDCGIVYKLDNPYIICVMTRGKTIPELESLIKDISREVYTIN